MNSSSVSLPIIFVSCEEGGREGLGPRCRHVSVECIPIPRGSGFGKEKIPLFRKYQLGYKKTKKGLPRFAPSRYRRDGGQEE